MTFVWDEAQLAAAAKYLNGNTARNWQTNPVFTAEDIASALARANIVPSATTVPDPAMAAELAAVKAKLAKLEAAITAAGLTIQEAE